MVFHTSKELADLGEQVLQKAVSVTAGKEYDQESEFRSLDNRAGSPMPSREAVRKAATNAYGDISALFSSFGSADPSKWNYMIDDLWTTAAVLQANPAAGSDGSAKYPVPPNAYKPPVPFDALVDSLKSRTGKWNGTAHYNFETNFVNRLDEAIPRQGWLAAALASALTFQSEFRYSANADIWAIGNKALKALDTEGGLCPSSGVVTATLSICTAFVPEVSAVIAVGSAVKGAYDAIEADLSPAAHPAPQQISGPTVDVIIPNVRTAIGNLTSAIGARDQQLCTFCDHIAGYVDERKTSFQVPAPNSITSAAGESANTLSKDAVFYL